MADALKFIDLYAGLGGFHYALAKIGFKCVFASECDPHLRMNYEKNFKLECQGDILKIEPSSIPDHDILCAGFPCQPFSKAGPQRGLEDVKNGKHIQTIVSILKKKSPKYFFLENVPNLLRHNQGQTWEYARKALSDAGYKIKTKVLSSEKYGSPQKRARLYIIGSKLDLVTFSWPEETDKLDYAHIHEILDKDPNTFKDLSDAQCLALDVWQEFMDIFPKHEARPPFPIWAQEFGCSYPIEDTSPFQAFLSGELHKYKGTFGQNIPLTEDWSVAQKFLPPYVRGQEMKLPSWKIKFLVQNRELYEELKDALCDWLPKLNKLCHSYQKFEWNFSHPNRSLEDTLIQFRMSGIRAKSDDFAPTLVSLNSAQIPIVGNQRRYMTFNECAKLQGLDAVFDQNTFTGNASSALGNAVNTLVVEAIGRSILHFHQSKQGKEMVAA